MLSVSFDIVSKILPNPGRYAYLPTTAATATDQRVSNCLSAACAESSTSFWLRTLLLTAHVMLFSVGYGSHVFPVSSTLDDETKQFPTSTIH